MKSNINDYKKYTIQAKRCIKGEAFFESLISEYSIPNHIVGPKDIGIDYICQWVNDNQPTQILFAVQVKTFSKEVTEVKPKGREQLGKNNLEKYEIKNSDLIIDDKTLYYWRTFNIPIYLFAICDEGKNLNCYYKRFTTVLTGATNINKKETFFYKVNDGDSFKAFSDPQNRIGGFARDLYIDYIRCAYHKGAIIYLNARSIGLNQYPDKDWLVFKGIFKDYKDQINDNYIQTKNFLERYDEESH